MRFTSAAILAIATGIAPATLAQQRQQAASFICVDNTIPINESDFSEPDWETIIEAAFPPWANANADGGCPRLDELGGSLVDGYEFPTPEDGKFNPCYYTKAFAGLDPMKGGYPTPIDTHYPYEFAAPFLKQPGDGSTHHCGADDVNIAA